MNNEQFRRLVQSTPSTKTPSSTRDVSATPSLGSRQRSSIPMTPRTVTGSSIDFARQLREQQQNGGVGGPPSKKFKSSAAPKGSKLAAGYVDRTQTRTSAEDDDKAARIKALEDMVKLGQMEQRDFERVRDEITGGEVANAHLVKGLDWKLLERVRRGEDVTKEKDTDKDEGGEGPSAVAGKMEAAAEVDEEELENQLDDLEKREVAPLRKEVREKKGEMAPPPSLPGGVPKKRTRDDILRELKESRARAKAEKEAAQPKLGDRFKRVGDRKIVHPRIERDEKGREVLITVDEEGREKRKVRKVPKTVDETRDANGLLLLDKEAAPLGMEAPLPSKQPEPEEEEGEMDIFEGAGADYDPLGGMDELSSDDSDSDDEGEVKEKKPKSEPNQQDKASPSTEPTDVTNVNTAADTTMPPPTSKPARRDYFGNKRSPSPPPSAPTNPLQDTSLLSALRKASSIAERVEGSGAAPHLSHQQAEEEAKKIAKRKAMLASVDRDADDMDMGFGGGRFDEEDDDGDGKVSEWGAEEKGEGKGDKGKRKRGGKKRKGDGNNVDDVMRVLEGRKKAEGSK